MTKKEFLDEVKKRERVVKAAYKRYADRMQELSKLEDDANNEKLDALDQFRDWLESQPVELYDLYKGDYY